MLTQDKEWQIYVDREIRRVQDEEYEKALMADMEKDHAEEIKANQQLNIEKAC